jgi:hypothetical protein
LLSRDDDYLTAGIILSALSANVFFLVNISYDDDNTLLLLIIEFHNRRSQYYHISFYRTEHSLVLLAFLSVEAVKSHGDW